MMSFYLTNQKMIDLTDKRNDEIYRNFYKLFQYEETIMERYGQLLDNEYDPEFID